MTAVALTTGIYSFTKKDDTLTVNTTDSKIEFVGSKTGGSHPGFFLLKSGAVSVSKSKLTGGSFVIDIASVKVTDGAGEKLAGHLKAADFFDVAGKGTEATYVISTVKYTDATHAEIDGKLTLKGITNPVKFIATTTGDAKSFTGDADFILDRTQFGINYGPGKVANEVTVKVHLVAAK